MEIKAIPEVEQMMMQITENISNIKLAEITNANYHIWDSISLAMKIQDYIDVIVKMHQQPNALQNKMSGISSILRSCNKNYIDIKLKFSSTSFGIISEDFNWGFKMEAISGADSILKDYTKQKTKKVQDLVTIFNLKNQTIPFRHDNIFNQYDNIKNLFLEIDGKLENPQDEQSIALTAMILYDLEQMSKVSFPAMIISQEMFDKRKESERWFSCLEISAKYNKPVIHFSK